MPASAYRIVVHIGMPKTGSTALQRAMLKNGRWLSERGLCYYPRSEPLGREIRQATNAADDLIRRYRDHMDRIARRTRAETMLISAEALAGRSLRTRLVGLGRKLIGRG